MSELTIKKMCEGCGHQRGNTCKVFSDPKYIYNHRNGKCFAKVTSERAQQIEDEIHKVKTEPIPTSNDISLLPSIAEKCSQYFIFRGMPKNDINDSKPRCTGCLWPRLDKCANVPTTL